MVIKRIELKDFMNSEHSIIEFKRGINVLSGSIGSGKSTVLEAISFCLLDKTRGSSWKGYVRRGSKGFEIDLDVEVEPNEIMNFHYVGKANSSTCEKVITYKDKTYVNSDTKIILESTFDIDMLSKVVFTMQKAPSLSDMTPADRRTIFKKIFNSDFSEIIEDIKKDQLLLTEEIVQKKANISALESIPYDLVEIIPVDDTVIDALNSELKESQLQEVEFQRYEMYVEKMRDVTKKQANLSKISEDKSIILSKLSTFDKEVQLFADKIHSQEVVIADHQKNVLDISSSIQKAKDDLATLNTELEELQDAFDAKRFSIKIKKLEDDKIASRTDLSIAQKHLETHKKGQCDACGQTCEPKNIEKFEQEIQTLTQKITSIEAEIAEIRKAESDSTLSIKKFEKEVVLAKETVSKRESDKRQAEMLVTQGTQNLNFLVTSQKRVMDSDIPSLKERLVGFDSLTEETNAELSRLQSWCEANKVEKKDATTRASQQIQAEISKILGTIESNAQKEKMNQATLLKKAESQQKIESITLAINEVQLKNKLLDEAKSVFDVEFPGFVNLKACSILESYMNSFFAQIKPDFKIKIDLDKKGVNLFYTSDESGEWGELKLTSGGEGMLVTLGFNVATAHSFKSELLILDEPDKSNDHDSSTRLFEAINSISGFKQLIVVSHQPSAMEYFIEQGANVYKVKKGTFEQAVV